MNKRGCHPIANQRLLHTLVLRVYTRVALKKREKKYRRCLCEHVAKGGMKNGNAAGEETLRLARGFGAAPDPRHSGLQTAKIVRNHP